MALLILGYIIYGKIVTRSFEPDDRETPAITMEDGVDYVVMPQWKLFLVQLLNIAGIGPIFGALQGAMWGPVVFFWITFGTIFIGGVHDYFSGMMSIRHKGESIAEVTGHYTGKAGQTVMRVFTVLLLVMVGTVFAVSPAALLKELFTNSGAGGILTSPSFWLAIILAYYFIATFISIDKIIGRLYPVFGICLILMAIGVIIGINTQGYEIPEIWNNLSNMHSDGKAIWPFMFVTVACGAVSGFHSTQSPLMARCMKSERQGRFVFYGAMTAEGIIALIWAAAGCAVYEVTGGLNTGLAEIIAKGQATAVYDVCSKTMPGILGTALAMIGVVVCPITSGDTAFRAARLTIADWFKIDQGKWKHRLLLCIPVLGIGAVLGFLQTFKVIDYQIIWRYFSWCNQTLAMIVLWTASIFTVKNGRKNYWITSIPAAFMTAVSFTYFFVAPECVDLSAVLGEAPIYIAGIIVSLAALVVFTVYANKYNKKSV